MSFAPTPGTTGFMAGLSKLWAGLDKNALQYLAGAAATSLDPKWFGGIAGQIGMAGATAKSMANLQDKRVSMMEKSSINMFELSIAMVK